MDDLSNWTGCQRPEGVTLVGQEIDIETWDISKHRDDLWNALDIDDANELMKFFPNEPFAIAREFGEWLEMHNANGTYQTMVFRQKATADVIGMASYMRIDEKNGSIEVGAVAHSPKMARSKLSTEAHYLMAKYVFENLGYRRYEWKLNNDNKPSHRSAKRFGFTFEGIFRQHIVDKGRNRNTAWYSMIDKEWPICKAAFEQWLEADNFDISGKQIKRLQDIRAALKPVE